MPPVHRSAARASGKSCSFARSAPSIATSGPGCHHRPSLPIHAWVNTTPRRCCPSCTSSHAYAHGLRSLPIISPHLASRRLHVVVAHPVATGAIKLPFVFVCPIRARGRESSSSRRAREILRSPFFSPSFLRRANRVVTSILPFPAPQPRARARCLVVCWERCCLPQRWRTCHHTIATLVSFLALHVCPFFFWSITQSLPMLALAVKVVGGYVTIIFFDSSKRTRSKPPRFLLSDEFGLEPLA